MNNPVGLYIFHVGVVPIAPQGLLHRQRGRELETINVYERKAFEHGGAN
jgi:hypothetical protein